MMITEKIFTIFFNIAHTAIGLMPSFNISVFLDFTEAFGEFVHIATFFLPHGFVPQFILSVGFWTLAQPAWGVVEFVLKRLPFVD